MARVTLVEASETLTVVAVDGRLDAAGVAEIELTLTTYTVTRRRPSIIDLTNIGYVASLGIGLLVTIARSMRQHGLPLVVVATNPSALKVLKLTAVDSLFPVVGTREEALRVLNAS